MTTAVEEKAVEEKPVSVNIPLQTVRDTEHPKVAAIAAQAAYLYEKFQNIVSGAEDPDKEWKMWLKEESLGDITPRAAEKLITLAEAIEGVELRQFSLSGLLAWVEYPKPVRDSLLAIADVEGFDYLTAKVVKDCYAIWSVENSDCLPESVKKELSALSGPPRAKVRKAAARYVKAVEALDGSSEEIDEALKVSLERAAKQTDALTALKEALPDLRAVKTLLDHTEQLESVQAVVLEGLKEECLTEAAKLVEANVKRALTVHEMTQLSLDLEDLTTQLKDVKGSSLGSVVEEVVSSGKKNNFKVKVKDNQVLHVQLELFNL